MINGAYILTACCISALSLIDRFIIKRREVSIISVSKADSDDRYIRFVLNFNIKHKLQNAYVTYTLRDQKNPATVITGKQRTLEFSSKGDNSEYLLINKKLVRNGDWVLDLKIESSGSRVNPLYKLFPIVSFCKKEFLINEA
ncbi:hypothetical protein VXS06_14335 [Photobacterium toruni]|uniref:Uncharacterized protein n=1 Tax=Photobacterium toruni TaxID=1935446 RepID=A0ABU6L8P4_9GAMM|nr:hypothetical protein [Photobacterium toruni]